MGSYEVTHAFDVRLPLGLKGWKVAIALGAATILAPVVGLVLLVLVGTLLPVLPILATLFVCEYRHLNSIRNHQDAVFQGNRCLQSRRGSRCMR
jgi:CHASE2 domain-containing sensor protein